MMLGLRSLVFVRIFGFVIIIVIILAWFVFVNCGYKWVPRIFKEGAEPTICPKCKSPYWNKLRRADIPKEVEQTMRKYQRRKG
ncbi:MAG: hypothetical protein ABSB26_00765 [Nitrososphaerales archaeon]